MNTKLFFGTLIAASALAVPAWASDVTWTGSASNGVWDTSSANWSGVSDETFTTGDNATFDDTGAGTITLGEAITAGSITFTGSGYTISDGTGTSLTASSLLFDGARDTSVTIDVSTLTVSGSLSVEPNGSDSGSEPARVLIIGSETNTTTATAGSLTLRGESELQISEGSTLTVTGNANSTGGFSDTISGAGTLIVEGTFTDGNSGSSMTISIANFQANALTKTSSNTLTFSSSGTVDIGTMNVNATGTVSLTGTGTYTIGEYVQEANANSGTSFEIGEGTTVTIGDFWAKWHQGATLGNGATLTVTTQMWFSTGSGNTEELTGGTFNIEELTVSNYATVYVHDTTLNIGAGDANRGGLKADEDGHFEFGDNLTVGVYAGASGTNTGWFTTDGIEFVGSNNAGTTFYTNEDETITLGGTLTGVGFTNSGSGTLTLSGTVSLSDAIINSGNIQIADGATFVLDDLTKGTKDDKDYYIVISGSGEGASVTGSIDIGAFSGGDVSSSWSVWSSGLEQGYLVIYGDAAQNLTWAGTGDGNNTWGYDSGSEWSGGSTFTDGDNVTFDTIGQTGISSTVNITSDVKPGSITVNDDYTFTTNVGDGVTVDASGSLTVASEATLTIDKDVTLYIDFEESSFSVDGKIAGEGTLELKLNSAYTSKINLGTDNGFTGTVYIVEGDFTLTGSNIGSGTYKVANGVNFQADGNTSTTVSNNIVIEGTTQLHVNSGGSLTISGNISGVEVSEDGNTVMGGTLDKHGTGTLTITGSVDIGTFIIDSSTANNDQYGNTTFSGSSVKIGTLNFGGAITVGFSGTGTHQIGELLVNTANTVHLDYSGLTGSLTITKLDFGNTGTIEIKGSTYGTITTVDFNYAGTLAITSGIVNVGSLTDTYTSNAHAATVTIAADSILSVNSMSFETGQAGNYCSSFSGAGDSDAGTLIVGTLTIGGSSGGAGAAVEIKDVTFISGSGGISFGTTNNGSNFYLFLDNVTWGFTGDTTIAAPTYNDTGVIELGDKTSGSLGTTTTSTKTTINTNQYSTTTNAFTTTGLTVTIDAVIAGSYGALEVTGNGKLVLSGANTFGGGLTITSGTVVAKSETALGAGAVTVSGGATLQLETAVSTTGAVTFNADAKLVISGALLASLATDTYDAGDGAIAIIVASDITFGSESLNSYSGNELDSLINAYVSAGDYVLTWTYDNGTLYASAVGMLPEPSMFGVFFGLGALGLVATRRRRRKVA